VQSRRAAMPTAEQSSHDKNHSKFVCGRREACAAVWNSEALPSYVEGAMLRPCFGRAALCVLWKKRHMYPDVEERRFSAALRDTV